MWLDRRRKVEDKARFDGIAGRGEPALKLPIEPDLAGGLPGRTAADVAGAMAAARTILLDGISELADSIGRWK